MRREQAKRDNNVVQEKFGGVSNLKKKVQITETVLRDANQSLMATRLPYSNYADILSTMDKAMLTDEYEAYAPAPAAPTPAAAAPAAAPAPATAPAAPAVTGTGDPVNSPMPGTILRVEVKEGDAVKAGQLLVVLEAMKMENEILAPKDGTVAQVVVSKGSHVETGSPLIVLA